MLIAGEPSGDLLASELVLALKQLPAVQAMPWPPKFFGAGGPRMAEAGVEVLIDLTAHSVFGLTDVLSQYRKFKGFFRTLLCEAVKRQPEAIVLVDFGGFNLRFAEAVRRYVRRHAGTFNVWSPRIIYYVSPQVWASRPGRAYRMARTVDLLLSIFPFEKDWYAKRVPQLRVEFVGHPLIDRHGSAECGVRSAEFWETPLVLLLPGSRKREIEAHLPAMAGAVRIIRRERAVRLRMVLPSLDLVDFASKVAGPLPDLEVQAKGLAESLREAGLSIASSGTVTLECGFFRVPTVVIYKTSWLTYQIAKQIITVNHIAMPNLLAGEALYPELIQSQATPEAIASATVTLLDDPSRLAVLKSKLSQAIRSLGESGASRRAAAAVVREATANELRLVP